MSDAPRPARAPDTPQASRWELIRDIAVFQLKLAVDALRDVVMVPVSLTAGLVDLLTGGERPGRLFYDVLIAGRRSEAWINLFGEADRVGPEPAAKDDPATIDRVVQRVEGLIVEQFERGGMTAAAKQAIDRSLNTLTKRSSSKRTDEERGARAPSNGLERR
jgi:hypothetical protein